MVKKRTIIYIDENDFKFYQKTIKNKKFRNNLHLFTLAALIGKHVVKKTKPIKGKKKDYIRVNDNLHDDNMVILKSIAISHTHDVSILNDENRLFEYCEEFANAGIEKIKEWDKQGFELKLSTALIDYWNEKSNELDKF